MPDEQLNREFRIIKLIWGAVLLSLVPYLIIGLVMGPKMPRTLDPDVFETMKSAFYVLAFVIVILSIFVRKLLLSVKSQQGVSEETFRRSLVQKYKVATAITSGMLETIAILGLVLMLLGNNPRDLYVLMLISGTAMWIYRPRKEELITLSRSRGGEVSGSDPT